MVEDSLDFSGRGRKIKNDSIMNRGVESTLDFSGRGRKITQQERESPQQPRSIKLPPATIRGAANTNVGVQGLFGSGNGSKQKAGEIKINKEDLQDIGKSIRGFIKGSEDFGKKLRGRKQEKQQPKKKSTKDRSATRKFTTKKTTVREALPDTPKIKTTPTAAQGALANLRMRFGLK